VPTIPKGFQPVVEGYSMDDPGGVMRTEVAGGAARYALDWARGPQRFTVTLILDSNQFAIWQAFYFYSIKKGAIAFDMPLDSGFGVANHSVNIMPGSYSAARTSGIMMVISFAVEAESMVYALGEDGATALLDLHDEYGAYAAATLARLARFATVDTLVL